MKSTLQDIFEFKTPYCFFFFGITIAKFFYSFIFAAFLLVEIEKTKTEISLNAF